MLKKIIKTFNRKAPLPNKNQPICNDEPGWHKPKTASELLDTPLRQKYLTTIWQNVSMSPEMFNALYRTPIEKYAEMVQLLPASESHHHSHLGGMLDHGLEVIAIATKIRQSYVLPQNSAPEEQAKQRDIWTAVVIYAALLHDIGKCAVDIEVILKDGSRWFPWQGIPKLPYNFRYIKGRHYQLHPTLGGFFANLLIPATTFSWIAPFPQAFSTLMYFIAGHTDKAGILADIIQKADQTSVTLALGGDPTKLTEKPKTSFAKQLLVAVREVVSGYKFNAQQGGCDGWLTADGLWVMSKSTADNIRATLMKQGIAVPSQNGKLFDELQTHKLIDVSADGKAIWNCKVTSNEGWTHNKPFSLLKIPANVAWETIEQRPTVFLGRVEILNSAHANIASHSPTDLPIDLGVPGDVPQIQPVEVKPNLPDIEPILNTDRHKAPNSAEPDLNNLDFVLDLFPVSVPSALTEPGNTLTMEPAEPSIPHTNPPIPETMVNQTAVLVNLPQTKQKVDKSNKRATKNIDVAQNVHLNGDELDPQKFIQWVKSGVITGTIFVNKPNALLHKVQDHLFLVTPNTFKIYLRDVVKLTDDESWELLQKRFQMLGIHRRQHTEEDSRNIWTCSVTGPNKKSVLRGFLIPQPELFIGDRLVLNNQWLTLQGELK